MSPTKSEQWAGLVARSRNHAWLFVLLAICLAVTAITLTFPFEEGVFPLDDAYIHLVYARNLAAGNGFCFNVGEQSYGFSSPLWVLLEEGILLTGFEPYWAVIVLSLGLFIGQCVLVYLLFQITTSVCQPHHGNTLFALAVSAVAAVNGNLVWLNFCGMETPLFVFLVLLSVYLYLTRGFSAITGFTLYLLFLTRITGLFLAILMLAFELLDRRDSGWGWLAFVIPVSLTSCLLFFTFGSIAPTTAGAKTVTYVSRGLDPVAICKFVPATFEYLFRALPHYLLLLGITGGALLAGLIRQRNKDWRTLRARLTASRGPVLLLFWMAGHYLMYLLLFRTLHHQLRYFAAFFPLLAVLGGHGLCCLRVRRGITYTVLLVLILTGAVNLRYWRTVYAGNVGHIKKLYMPAAEWIRRETPPDAKIAAFDIGVLGYLAERKIVGTAGLLDPNIHFYLDEHRAGSYLGNQKPDYIVYSRNNDCDFWTGTYVSEYESPKLLKQHLVHSFYIRPYATPTITHSHRLDIYKVDGWLPDTRQGRRKAFTVENPRIDFPVDVPPHHGAQFAGISLNTTHLTYHPDFPLGIHVSYFFRTKKQVNSGFLVLTAFVHEDSQNRSIESCWARIRKRRLIPEKRRIPEQPYQVFGFEHRPTHMKYPPKEWRPGEIIRESHYVWIPRVVPGRYNIWVSLRPRENERREWIRTGILDIEKQTYWNLVWW